jgi:hypothetical protein
MCVNLLTETVIEQFYPPHQTELISELADESQKRLLPHMNPESLFIYLRGVHSLLSIVIPAQAGIPLVGWHGYPPTRV